MSDVVKTLAEEPRKALVALAMFRFLTTKQLVRLGVAASETVMRDYVLDRLERRHKPLAEGKKLSRWLPHVHYLTKHGAAELAELYKLPIEDIKFPKGKVQFGERLAQHRFAQVDFHIGLRQWANTREDTTVIMAAMDFDVEGSRIHGTFKNPTQIDLPNQTRPVIADGVFSIEVNNTPLLYALEVHRTTQTKAVGMQIQRYMDVLQSGALAFKYELQAPTYVCSVHVLPNVLKGAKKYLMSNPNFEPYRKFFLFNSAENLTTSFSDGWHFADDTPANPFPRPQNPALQRLLDDL